MKTRFQLAGWLFLLAFTSLVFIQCNSDDDTAEPGVASCTDGILNQDETGIDCGGVCPVCPSCTDGIQNQGEEDVDCGGPCPACPSCSDGIQNQGETGVDCGGPCSACPFSEKMTCEINGVAFTANLVAGSLVNGEIQFQSDQGQEDQLFFTVPATVVPGTFSFSSAGFEAEFKRLFAGVYTTESGEITITAHDLGPKQLSGTFEFTAVEYEFGVPIDTVVITNGDFGVEYF